MRRIEMLNRIAAQVSYIEVASFCSRGHNVLLFFVVLYRFLIMKQFKTPSPSSTTSPQPPRRMNITLLTSNPVAIYH